MIKICNKMGKTSVGTILKPNQTIVEKEVKSTPLATIYMISLFPTLEQAL